MLEKKDYEEPCCPLEKPTNITPIPTSRVIEKLDAYFAKNDLAGAERHLQYWLATAEQGNDARGKLTVVNEQVGLYRKLGRKQEALAACEMALHLAEELQAQDLTKAICGNLEKHAYSVNDDIEDFAIRNIHILAAV